MDDEPLALRRLAASLRIIPEVEVVESTTSARRALDLIVELEPDVVFLDVTMPGLDGFGIVERMHGDARPAVVFVTAYEKFAASAFEAEAIDYLLKPVSCERLSKAVERVRQWLAGRRKPGAIRLDEGSEMYPAEPDGDALWSHRHNSFERVPIAEIIWLEAQGDYVRVHSVTGRSLVRTTLSDLEKRLGSRRFLRTHRSAICRKNAIVRVRRKMTGAFVVTLANGDEAPLGRTYSSGLRSFLEQIATNGEGHAVVT